MVNGVNKPQNHAGSFLDMGGGGIRGFDYCWWPNGSSAFSLTVSNSYGAYIGYDYYWCLN